MSNENTEKSAQNRFLFIEENDLFFQKGQDTKVRMTEGRSEVFKTVPLLDSVFYNGTLDDFQKGFDKMEDGQKAQVIEAFKQLLCEVEKEKYGNINYKAMKVIKEPIIEEAEDEEKDKHRYNRILVILFEVDDILDAKEA
jgi:hypothetical protein